MGGAGRQEGRGPGQDPKPRSVVIVRMRGTKQADIKILGSTHKASHVATGSDALWNRKVFVVIKAFGNFNSSSPMFY